MPPPPKEYLCHGRARPFEYRPGADLFEDPAAELLYVKQLQVADKALADAGFTRVEGSNAWEKDGIFTTTDHAAREGIAAVLSKTTDAVAVNFPNRPAPVDAGGGPPITAPGAAGPATDQQTVSSLGGRTI